MASVEHTSSSSEPDASGAASSNPTTPEPPTTEPPTILGPSIPSASSTFAAAEASTSTQTEPPVPIPMKLVSSSIHHLSDFWKALSAPFTPLELVNAALPRWPDILPLPKTPEPPTSEPGPSTEHVRANSMTPSPPPPERGEREISRPSSPVTPPPPSYKQLDGSQLGRVKDPLYKPPGKWAQLRSAPKELLAEQHLDNGRTYELAIKKMRARGVERIGEFLYVSKLYKSYAPTSPANIAFYRELFLYKTSLKTLQSSVVPTLINVYSTTDGFEMAFTPPHSSFWVEATADMPELLKERVIRAYEALHSKGVLHGQVNPRNILIGGDGLVTLVNFEESGTRGGHSGYWIPGVSPGALELEMREVKYRLDYKGARAKEAEKREKHKRRLRYNTREKQKADDTPGYEPKLKLPKLEDVAEPPVDDWDWDYWNKEQPKARRFIMPGQDAESLQKSIEAFLSWLDHECRDSRAPVSGGLESPPGSPPPPLPKPVSSGEEKKALPEPVPTRAVQPSVSASTLAFIKTEITPPPPPGYRKRKSRQDEEEDGCKERAGKRKRDEKLMPPPSRRREVGFWSEGMVRGGPRSSIVAKRTRLGMDDAKAKKPGIVEKARDCLLGWTGIGKKRKRDDDQEPREGSSSKRPALDPSLGSS